MQAADFTRHPKKEMLLPEMLPVAGKPSRPRTRSILENAIAEGRALQADETQDLQQTTGGRATGNFRRKVWDDHSSSWESGKSPHSKAREEYFGTSVLFPLGDLSTGARPEYGRTSAQYGVSQEARPQSALVDLHAKVVQRSQSQQGPPVKNRVTFHANSDVAQEMRWAGIDANAMLRNSTPNTRTRWNRNASSIAWHTIGNSPEAQYVTTSSSEANHVLKLAKQAGYYLDPDDDKKSYVGTGRTRRTDTMVSGDAPAWFQIKHIPVRKLNSVQLSTLLDWNAPIPEEHVKPGLLKAFKVGTMQGGAPDATKDHPDVIDNAQLKVPAIAPQVAVQPPNKVKGRERKARTRR